MWALSFSVELVPVGSVVYLCIVEGDHRFTV
jgi:hypothetical protein